MHKREEQAEQRRQQQQQEYDEAMATRSANANANGNSDVNGNTIGGVNVNVSDSDRQSAMNGAMIAMTSIPQTVTSHPTQVLPTPSDEGHGASDEQAQTTYTSAAMSNRRSHDGVAAARTITIVPVEGAPDPVIVVDAVPHSSAQHLRSSPHTYPHPLQPPPSYDQAYPPPPYEP